MRISWLALLLLFAAMTACKGPTPTSPVQPDPGQEAHPPKAPPEQVAPELVNTLAGEWRVAAIDGLSLNEPIAIALTGDERQLWWAPRCAGVARIYRIEGASISFGSTQPPRPAGSPTPPVCAIGLPPRLGDVTRALDNAAGITRTPSNGVLISGPNHSVTLFSQ